MRISVVTPPVAEPVTLEEVKLHLRVDYTDDDTLIGSLISAARSIVEARVKMSLSPQTISVTVDDWRDLIPDAYWSREILHLPQGPLVSVVSVEYTTDGVTQTWDDENYVVSPGLPGRLSPKDGHSYPDLDTTLDAVTITYTVGEDTIPPAARSAILLLVAHWYENRAAASETSLSEIPLAVEYLLSSIEWGYCP